MRVHATSINPLDYQVRRGDYRDLVPLPAITGHDVSGVVEAVGPGVTTFSPGDEVWYTPQIFDGPGSYAEYHVAAENIVGKKPASLSHLEAASLSLVGGTVWEALVGRATLRVGESILIHGGAGGVGHVAIQVAKAIGARVFTTVREAQLRVRATAWGPMWSSTTGRRITSTPSCGKRVAAASMSCSTPSAATPLSRSPDALAQLGRVVSIVDIAQPQNLDRGLGQERELSLRFHTTEPRQAR